MSWRLLTATVCSEIVLRETSSLLGEELGELAETG